MLDRDKILKEAVIRCYREMYRKAQPRANFDDYRRKIRNGIIPEDTRIYERHYLPQKEYEYIVDKYVKAYGFDNQWKSDVEFIISTFNSGGWKDVYKDDRKTIERTKSLKERIGEKNANKVIEFIQELLDFHNFDRLESQFRATVALGCSPTSNPKTVIDYWRSQGIEIVIDEKKNLDKDDYWDIDYYGHIVK